MKSEPTIPVYRQYLKKTVFTDLKKANEDYRKFHNIMLYKALY